MKGNKCNIIRDVLPLYVDEVVCADTKEWVEAHIADCADCRRILEGMRAAAAVPPQTDITALKKFKRRIGRGRLIAAVVAALAVLAVVACAVVWLCGIEIIEYDGSNIEVVEIDDGYELMACYYGRGGVGYGFSTNVDTGVSSLIVTQVRWKKYIEPLFLDASNEFYLVDTDDTLRVELQSGEVLWEADEKQRERYFERREAETEE